MGSWEGYVAGPTDLYYRGNDAVGMTTTSSVIFEDGQMRIDIFSADLNFTYNFVGRSILRVEGTTNNSPTGCTLRHGNISVRAGYDHTSSSGVRNYTIDIPLGNFQVVGAVKLIVDNANGFLFRISAL